MRLRLAVLGVIIGCTAPASTTTKKHATNHDPSAPADDDVTSPGSPNEPGLVFRGGHVLDPSSHVMDDVDVFVCDGRIVDHDTGLGCASNVIDVSGRYLVPGFFDAHVHVRGVSLGNGDFSAMGIEEELALFRIAGVTGVLDGMNDEAKIFDVRAKQRAGGATGADVVCAGGAFTPTKGHGTEYGLASTFFHVVDTTTAAKQQVDLVAAKAPDVVKIMYDHLGLDGAADVKDGQEGALGVAMKKEVMIAIIAAARASHLKTEVHIGTWQDARDAIEAGATMIAHLGEPAMPDDIAQLAAANGVFWVPTLSLYHGVPDVTAHPELLDDPLLAKTSSKKVIDSYRPGKIAPDPYDVQWRSRHGHDFEAVAKLKKAGVKLMTGTDAVETGVFAGWSMHREMKLLVQAGLSEWDALTAATSMGGIFVGEDLGITPGAAANIVVLDASPLDDIWNTTKIHAVYHRGALVHAP